MLQNIGSSVGGISKLCPAECHTRILTLIHAAQFVFALHFPTLLIVEHYSF